MWGKGAGGCAWIVSSARGAHGSIWCFALQETTKAVGEKSKASPQKTKKQKGITQQVAVAGRRTAADHRHRRKYTQYKNVFFFSNGVVRRCVHIYKELPADQRQCRRRVHSEKGPRSRPPWQGSGASRGRALQRSNDNHGNNSRRTPTSVQPKKHHIHAQPHSQQHFFPLRTMPWRTATHSPREKCHGTLSSKLHRAITPRTKLQ